MVYYIFIYFGWFSHIFCDVNHEENRQKQPPQQAKINKLYPLKSNLSPWVWIQKFRVTFEGNRFRYLHTWNTKFDERQFFNQTNSTRKWDAPYWQKFRWTLSAKIFVTLWGFWKYVWLFHLFYPRNNYCFMFQETNTIYYYILFETFTDSFSSSFSINIQKSK